MFKGGDATVITTCGQIDVVQRIDGMPPFQRLVSEGEVFEVEGMSVPVMSRQVLIELKRRRGSQQDLADVAAIEQLDELDE